jgi:3-hydroxymyristoyl/3-hydroxydecanoyl-(acyl carrier protein) dehydratase
VISLPEIDSIARTRDGQTEKLHLQFSVSAALRYFEGHFPDLPLLPGVVQIGWAVELARLHLAPTQTLGEFHSLTGVKFMRVIQPGETVLLTLSMDADERELSFEYQSGGHSCSGGRVLFH